MDTRLEDKETKKSKAKDSPSEDRPSQGQGHNVEVISKKKVFAPKTCKFSENSSVLQENKCLQKFFCKLSGVLQDETKLFLTSAHFQPIKN